MKIRFIPTLPSVINVKIVSIFLAQLTIIWIDQTMWRFNWNYLSFKYHPKLLWNSLKGKTACSKFLPWLFFFVFQGFFSDSPESLTPLDAGVLIVLGLAAALRLSMECCKELGVMRDHVHTDITSSNPLYHPGV